MCGMTAGLAIHLLAACTYDGSPGSYVPPTTDTPAERAERSRIEQARVQRIRESDETAFREMMHEYFDRVTKFTYGFVNDRDTAEDIAQDVFARIWEQHTTWKPTVSVRAYLFGAARHRALDVLKHRQVYDRYAISVIPDIQIAENPSADTALEISAELAALRRAVVALPERRRAALSLRYQLGLSHAEVGVALGVTAKAAKELIVRTIDALRTELKTLR
jgi:RNA polymerase sigma-70 factor (ECF subfamily)